MKKIILTIIVLIMQLAYGQNLIDSYLIQANNTITIRGDSEDGLHRPRDLDFHRSTERENELWVINEVSAIFDENVGGSTVTYYNAGTESQWAEYRKDTFSAHFMHTASAIAFSENGTFANTLDVQDANNNSNGYFSGCTLWDSDTSIYARVNQNGPLLGSHLDMIHQSPFSEGIASESENIYWLFDGFHSSIVKYDFQQPHEHGGDNHYDGLLYRHDDVQVMREPGLSSHLDLDENTGWLYICDTGNQRILRMNINSGQFAETLETYGEYLELYARMEGTEWEEIPSSDLTFPTGLDIHNGRLLISDFATGDIIIFDIDGEQPVELGKFETGLPDEIMGIKVSHDGSIWYVCTNANELHQVTTILMGDIDGDGVYTLVDLTLCAYYLMGDFEIAPENLNSADVNYDNTIDIFDVIMIGDLIPD